VGARDLGEVFWVWPDRRFVVFRPRESFFFGLA
jgi:hypothetical protein